MHRPTLGHGARYPALGPPPQSSLRGLAVAFGGVSLTRNFCDCAALRSRRLRLAPNRSLPGVRPPCGTDPQRSVYDVHVRPLEQTRTDGRKAADRQRRKRQRQDTRVDSRLAGGPVRRRSQQDTRALTVGFPQVAERVTGTQPVAGGHQQTRARQRNRLSRRPLGACRDRSVGRAAGPPVATESTSAQAVTGAWGAPLVPAVSAESTSALEP